MPTISVTFDTITKIGTVSIDETPVADLAEFHLYVDRSGRGSVELCSRTEDQANGLYSYTRVMAAEDGSLVRREPSEEDVLLAVAERYTIGKITQKQRDAVSESDFGWPEERKYPIRSADDVESAAKLIGKAPSNLREKIKQRIIKIAKRKGFPIPDAWKQ